MSLTSRAARLSPWARVVLASAVVLGAVAVALGVWSLASAQEQRVTYPVGGQLTGLELDLGPADLVVQGAGQTSEVRVEHEDHYGFGHGPETVRSVAGGVFRIFARCPTTVLHGCSMHYRIAVPDNVPLTVRTSTGDVQLRGYRGSAQITTDGGDIDVGGFCGFSLQARADGAGDVTAATTCPPARLSLRSTTGTVRARVPAGRYSVDASTGHGRPVVRGLEQADDAPFTIQALSGSGAVFVEPLT